MMLPFECLHDGLRTCYRMPSGLDHKSGTRNPREDVLQVVTRSSLTLRVAGLSLLATARVMIKAVPSHASIPSS